jgi:hypothetical protein
MRIDRLARPTFDWPIGMPSGRRWSSGSRSGISRCGPRASARVSTPTPGAAYPRAVRRSLLPPADKFESIAERKLRRRQLTEDGNVEISGCDLREVPDAKKQNRLG